jgi:hypothetical protein
VNDLPTHCQSDLFGSDTPDEDSETPTFHPDPDEIRAELHRILAEMKAASALPWDERRTALYRTVFPQMTGALPDDEGAQLRFEFDAELERLKAA